MNPITITLHTQGGEMPVYEAIADSPNGCAVIVVQEAFEMTT